MLYILNFPNPTVVVESFGAPRMLTVKLCWTVSLLAYKLLKSLWPEITRFVYKQVRKFVKFLALYLDHPLLLTEL